MAFPGDRALGQGLPETAPDEAEMGEIRENKTQTALQRWILHLPATAGAEFLSDTSGGIQDLRTGDDPGRLRRMGGAGGPGCGSCELGVNGASCAPEESHGWRA